MKDVILDTEGLPKTLTLVRFHFNRLFVDDQFIHPIVRG
jgi:hypothetical protein